MIKKVPATYMRGGSSKGLFFNEDDLPVSSDERDEIFLQALGSPDPYERQLDGMGGGVSSLSKIAIIAPSARSDADIDYTFGQVAVNKPLVDYKANCGNLSSAAGPFAVDEGLIMLPDGERSVRIFNTNTQKIIRSIFHVTDGRFNPKGDFAIAGVPGTGSRIRLEFTNPAGALTGKLLPSGNSKDHLRLSKGREIEASLVDASNPVVFIAASSVGLNGTELPYEMEKDRDLMADLDEIRRLGGVLMGLADNPDDVPLSNPKIALVAAPKTFVKMDGEPVADTEFQISMRILSMERVHLAVTATGAMCCAAAVNISNTIPNDIVDGRKEISIGNPSGVFPVGALIKVNEGATAVESLHIYRTARRLMDGYVYLRQW